MKVDDQISLKPVNSQDSIEFFKLAKVINAGHMDYLPEIVELCVDESSARFLLADYEDKAKETGAPDFFILFEGKICGIIGFAPWDKGQYWGELGYWVAPTYQRRDIASRCVSFLINYAFNKLFLDEVRFLIEPKNKASLRLVQKLGFSEGKCFEEKGVHYSYFSIKKAD